MSSMVSEHRPTLSTCSRRTRDNVPFVDRQRRERAVMQLDEGWALSSRFDLALDLVVSAKTTATETRRRPRNRVTAPHSLRLPRAP
jgi:hypothetical protein